MASTTIQVSKETRDHLAALATERGLTLGQLVQHLAEREPTKAQIAERLKADRDHARTLLDVEMTDEEFDNAPDVLGNIYRLAAEKVRTARGEVA
ncbi:hypothetical protein [Streptomyces sp. NPDC090025]|uniref:hypothetical protein n=1 Tax=Streptomyces sp. NPDC090025 TaxID=3365922 RepID=UPI0038383808